MPCDSVVRTTVNLSKLKVESLDLLVAALEALGYAVNVTGSVLFATHRQHGSLTFNQATGDLRQEAGPRQRAQDVNQIKVGYSQQVVKKIASKFGWSLKDAKASGAVAAAFTASKRRF